MPRQQRLPHAAAVLGSAPVGACMHSGSAGRCLICSPPLMQQRLGAAGPATGVTRWLRPAAAVLGLGCAGGASRPVLTLSICGVLLCSEGGFFNARLTFPKDYPNQPPQCRFTSEMWHPNGEVARWLAATTCHAECSHKPCAWLACNPQCGYKPASHPGSAQEPCLAAGLMQVVLWLVSW